MKLYPNGYPQVYSVAAIYLWAVLFILKSCHLKYEWSTATGVNILRPTHAGYKYFHLQMKKKSKTGKWCAIFVLIFAVIVIVIKLLPCAPVRIYWISRLRTDTIWKTLFHTGYTELRGFWRLFSWKKKKKIIYKLPCTPQPNFWK